MIDFPTPESVTEGLRLAGEATGLPWDENDCRATQEADEGHWFATGPLHDPEGISGSSEYADDLCRMAAERDAAYIVHAANSYPALARDWQRMREALEAAQKFADAKCPNPRDCDCAEKAGAIIRRALSKEPPDAER